MVALGTAVIGLPSLADSPAMYRPRVGWLQSLTVPRSCASRVANSVQSIISTPPGPTAVDASTVCAVAFCQANRTCCKAGVRASGDPASRVNVGVTVIVTGFGRCRVIYCGTRDQATIAWSGREWGVVHESTASRGANKEGGDVCLVPTARGS